ncbi:MAG: HEPN domain-containing protein [Nanoarchaeota archaeon]|nr:HEPN domain-containing protein [Nanoarchaeota archaeon]MBU1703789.1 HEPN domain-containing protein [Nanoarchaeota archaeon]
MKWCLKDPNRLIKIQPDDRLAQDHLDKSEYNSEVMKDLENLKRFDWALNVGFYAIYHCFLAVLAKHGYESKNQRCSISAILKLIDDKKIDFDKELVLQFDTLEVDKEAARPTIRQSRETSTYGIASSIDTKQLDEVKEIIKKIQRETIKVLSS